jgi:hypothetical protein
LIKTYPLRDNKISQVGDSTTSPKYGTSQATAGLGNDGGSGKPTGQTSRPPSIHDGDSSSSDESEGETSEARRRRKAKMEAKIEKKVKKLMRKTTKEESKKHPFFGLYQVPHNYA